MGNVNGRVVEVDLGDKKVTLDKVYGNQYVVCVDQLRGDSQTIASAVEECIQYMVKRGGGEIIVPPNAEEDEVRIKVYKNKESHKIEVRFQVRSFRPPIEEETRPYTGDDWEVGDLVLGTPNEEAVVYAWICKEKGVPGVWKEVGANNEDLSKNIQSLGQQIAPLIQIVNGSYLGRDLTVVFAKEIEAFDGDPWAWIQSRIEIGEYSGIYPGDYIQYQTGVIEGLDEQFTVVQQIAGIDTYYGTEVEEGVTIGHHIDWVSKDSIARKIWGIEDIRGTWLWYESEIYDFLNTYVKAALPTQVLNVIKEKKAYVEYRELETETNSIICEPGSLGMLWLPTEREVFGDITYGSVEGNKVSYQYSLFDKIPGSKSKKLEDVRTGWWTISASGTVRNERCFVNYDGFPSKGRLGEDSAGYGVPICFRMMQTEE